MNSEKTTLPALRSTKWRTVKAETNKVNQVLTYISTNNIIKLNELIYEEAKLGERKWGSPQRGRKKNQIEDGNFDWRRR